MELCKDNYNKCVFECFYYFLFFSLYFYLLLYILLYLRWVFNRGEDNIKIFIEKIKRWFVVVKLSWLVDRGFVYSILLIINLRF